MLKKLNRLPAGQKLTTATTVSNEYFRILIQPNGKECSRFGFVVGKKVDKRAVVRNRLKRVLREAVKDFLQSPKGYDVLFIVKKSFEEVPTKELFENVQTMLEKFLTI